MSNLGLKLLMMQAAILGAASQECFDKRDNRRQLEEESPKDRERRERCEQMAIEKAKAKRERKAAKLRLISARKEK